MSVRAVATGVSSLRNPGVPASDFPMRTIPPDTSSSTASRPRRLGSISSARLGAAIDENVSTAPKKIARQRRRLANTDAINHLPLITNFLDLKEDPLQQGRSIARYFVLG